MTRDGILHLTPGRVGRSDAAPLQRNFTSQSVRCARWGLGHFIGHEEEGLVIKAGELGAQSRGVVLLLDVDDLFGGSDGLERNVVVVAVLEDDEAAADVFQEEIESEIAVGHGGDGVNGIGIAAADEIAELLVDDVDCFTVVEFGGEVSYLLADDVADAAELFVAVGVGAFAFEDHLAAFKHGAFGDEDDGVAAGILAAIGDEQFGEVLDIEFVFGNDAAIGGAGHGGKHGGEACVAAEDFEDHEALVGAGGSTEAIDHLNGAGDAGAEADAVVGAGDVVVHGLGNADDFEAFFVEANAIAERVVAADGDESIDAKPGEILEDFGSEVVLLGGEFVLEMRGDAGFADAARIGAGRMEKGAAGAAGAIDDLFVEKEEIVGIVVILFANHVDEAGPAVANADDLVTFADGAESDATNGGVETGNVAASGEDADDALLGVDVCHDSRIALSLDVEQEIILFGGVFRKSEGEINFSG